MSLFDGKSDTPKETNSQRQIIDKPEISEAPFNGNLLEFALAKWGRLVCRGVTLNGLSSP